LTVQPTAQAADERIAVHVLTGFLGSGKTTFLRRLLADPDMVDTAVVINEFGEVGLDHLLVREISEDAVLLPSGCLCCAVRDDLVSTLADLHAMVTRGQSPPFRRLVVETTGLADPAPIVQAVMSDLRLRRAYRPGSIIVAVDAVSGSHSIGNFTEAKQQVALADCVIVTKTDLVEPWQLERLALDIARVNPAVRRLSSSKAASPSADEVLEQPADWNSGHAAVMDARTGRHGAGIETFTIDMAEPVSWPAFVEWLELLLASRGQSILRVKGLLRVAGEDRPVVIQGVQHVVYPPEYLSEWPDGDPSGWLVFIARDLTPTAILNSLSSLASACCRSDAAAESGVFSGR
jgi:G3E family GTPase